MRGALDRSTGTSPRWAPETLGEGKVSKTVPVTGTGVGAGDVAVAGGDVAAGDVGAGEVAVAGGTVGAGEVGVSSSPQAMISINAISRAHVMNNVGLKAKRSIMPMSPFLVAFRRTLGRATEPQLRRPEITDLSSQPYSAQWTPLHEFCTIFTPLVRSCQYIFGVANDKS